MHVSLLGKKLKKKILNSIEASPMTTKYKYIFLEYTYTYHYSGKKFKNNLKCLRKRRHPKITLYNLLPYNIPTGISTYS